MNNPSTKIFIEATEHDIVTLRKYAEFLNLEGKGFFNWRTALNHLLAEARIEMNSASLKPQQEVPEELPFDKG